jgi:Flp pilus assembly protein TadD
MAAQRAAGEEAGKPSVRAPLKASDKRLGLGTMKLSLQTLRALQYAEGYLALGMKREAAEALAEMVAGENDTLPALAMRAAVFHELGDWPRAAEAATLLCERSPEDARHWIQRAYAVRRASNIEDARGVLLEAMERHPEEAIIRFNLACYEAQLGRLAEARKFLAEACRLNPDCVDMANTDPDLEPLR